MTYTRWFASTGWLVAIALITLTCVTPNGGADEDPPVKTKRGSGQIMTGTFRVMEGATAVAFVYSNEPGRYERWVLKDDWDLIGADLDDDGTPDNRTLRFEFVPGGGVKSFHNLKVLLEATGATAHDEARKHLYTMYPSNATSD